MCAGAFSLVSGVIGAVSQFQQGKAQAALHRHQAQVQRRNARIARDKGALNAVQERRNNQRAQGEFIASAPTRGLALGGSSEDALTDLINEGELRRAAVLYDAEVSRTNSLVAADRAEAQARIAKSSATAGLVSSAFGLAGKFGRSSSGGLAFNNRSFTGFN